MSAEGEHGRILAAAARTALTPLGFWRKGRSRVWWADRGFWLAVVEFQPSSFSKGSYLNVAAHWHWGAMPNVPSQDYILVHHRRWIDFEDANQFLPLADRLAREGAEATEELESKFANMSRTAAELLVVEEGYAAQGRGGGWPAFNAAVPVGLTGDMATSRRMFDAAYQSLVPWRSDFRGLLEPYLEAAGDGTSFRVFIERRIDERRAEYGLEPLGSRNEQS